MADGRSCKVGHAMKRQLALLLMRRIRVEGPLRDPEVTAWPLPLAVALPPILLLIQILNLAPTLTPTLALTLTLTLILTLTLTLTLTTPLAPPLAPPLSR